MDKSETYIKMADCPEIQGGWNPQPCDFHYHFSCNEEDDHADAIDYDELDGEDNYNHVKERSIWLPTQSQLQKMLGDFRKTLGILVYLEQSGLSAFKPSGADYHIESWEQLWLAFVMKEKFNKVWNGEEWDV